MTEPIDQLFSAVSVSQSDPYDTFKQHPRYMMPHMNDRHVFADQLTLLCRLYAYIYILL